MLCVLPLIVTAAGPAALFILPDLAAGAFPEPDLALAGLAISGFGLHCAHAAILQCRLRWWAPGFALLLGGLWLGIVAEGFDLDRDPDVPAPAGLMLPWAMLNIGAAVGGLFLAWRQPPPA